MDAAGLQKLFEPFAAVTIKSMFGGRGVSVEGLIFALQAGDKVYLKTDAITAPRFKEAGSEPYVFRSPMGPKETSYWLMPAVATNNAEKLKTWCGLALAAARRAADAKKEKAASRGKGEKAAMQNGRAKATSAETGPRRKAAKTPPAGSRASRKGRTQGRA